MENFKWLKRSFVFHFFALLNPVTHIQVFLFQGYGMFYLLQNTEGARTAFGFTGIKKTIHRR